MPNHLVTDFDSPGIAQRVGSAVAFDYHAVESQKDAAIGMARIHLVPQSVEGAASEEIPDFCRQASVHRVAEILRHLLGCALGALQRDVSCKALRDDHVDSAFADIVAFDEPL